MDPERQSYGITLAFLAIAAARASSSAVSLLLAVSEARAELGLFRRIRVLMAVWGRFELRVSQPLVDMRLPRRRGVWTTN